MSAKSVSRSNSDQAAGAGAGRLPSTRDLEPITLDLKPSTRDLKPITRDLKLVRLSSLAIAMLAVGVSLAGIISGSSLYETEELLLLKAPTDLFTLIVAVPILLVSMWLVRRGWLLGLLCWPAPLLYMLYIYLTYATGVPFGVLFLPYAAIAALGAYTLIGLIACIDAKRVRRRLAGTVPTRSAGAILIALSVLFSLMNLAYVVTALSGATVESPVELPVWLADFLVLAPAWIIGGTVLWRRYPLGYVAGMGLLLVGCMLFLGAIFALVYTALYTASPLDLAGVGIMLAASLVCVIPFALFARGVLRSGRGAPPERHEDGEDPDS